MKSQEKETKLYTEISDAYYDYLQNPPEELNDTPLIHQLITSLIRNYIAKIYPNNNEDITLRFAKSSFLPEFPKSSNDNNGNDLRLKALEDWAKGHSYTLSRLTPEEKIILHSELNARIVRSGTAGGIMNECAPPIFEFQEYKRFFDDLDSKDFLKVLLNQMRNLSSTQDSTPHELFQAPPLPDRALGLFNTYFPHYMKYFTPELVNYFLSLSHLPHLILQRMIEHYEALQNSMNPNLQKFYEILYEKKLFELLGTLSEASNVPLETYLSPEKVSAIKDWNAIKNAKRIKRGPKEN